MKRVTNAQLAAGFDRKTAVGSVGHVTSMLLSVQQLDYCK